MSRIIQLSVLLLFLFVAVGCSEEAPKQAEQKNTAANPFESKQVEQPAGQKNTAENPFVQSDASRPVKDSKSFMIQDVKAWKTFKGNAVKAQKDGSVLLTSSLSKPQSAGRTQSAFVMIPIPQAMEQSGKTVQVTIEAAKPKKNGASEFAAAFSTADVGNSGWKKFIPTESFVPYTFTYKVPKCKKCNENFIGVWADTKGAGKGLLVKSIGAKILH